MKALPKIIKDIEDKILFSAIEAFGEYGYAKSDMKKIAAGAGIAVGTLYNYFPNKKELFKNVFSKSWEMTFEKLDEVHRGGGSSIEKIENFIAVLYDDVTSRKGLGRELIRADVLPKDFRKDIRNAIFDRLDSLFESYLKESGISIETSKRWRLSDSLISTLMCMHRAYPGERDENIEFVFEMVKRYLG